MSANEHNDDRDAILAANPLADLWPALVGDKARGGGWPCPNPDHAQTGATPPVSITPARGPNPDLWKCHGCDAAGTAIDAVMHKMGVPLIDAKDWLRARAGLPAWEPTAHTDPADLIAPTGPPKIVDTYDYTDETGALLFQVVRFEPKTFRQRRPDGNGGFIWGLADTRRVPYRLAKVIDAASRGEVVFIVEGEKDVHALEATGVVATTNPMGAGKWHTDYNEPLRGAILTIWADNDEPGRNHARDVQASLASSGIDADIVYSIHAKDPADHLAGGHRDDGLEPIGDEAVEPTAPRFLEFQTMAQLVAEVDAMPAPSFLAEPVWPADAYGIIGAEDKAGKSWVVLDLAVAVASGGKWLDRFTCQQGPVLVFLGEGGKRKTLRRLRAIANFTNANLSDLDIVVCHRVPHLSAAGHLAEVHEQVEAHPPRLAIVDPLYLAAKGAKSSDLYEMGAVLEPIQHLCQQVGAALVIVTHWNKTGVGTGRERFTGAGTKEWGRVLCSMSVESKRSEQPSMATIVTLIAEFIGDEIPDTDHRFERRVVTDDPLDLASPMRYSVTNANTIARPDAGEWDGPSNCMGDVRQFFEDHPGEELSKSAAPDRMRAALPGFAYQNRTIGLALEQLAEQGVLTVNSGRRNARLFRLHRPEEHL